MITHDDIRRAVMLSSRRKLEQGLRAAGIGVESFDRINKCIVAGDEVDARDEATARTLLGCMVRVLPRRERLGRKLARIGGTLGIGARAVEPRAWPLGVNVEIRDSDGMRRTPLPPRIAAKRRLGLAAKKLGRPRPQW